MAKQKKDPNEGKFAWTATVGEKGQIVIPKQARELFNIKPGDTILILGDAKQGMAIPPQNMFTEVMKKIFPMGQKNSKED